MKKILSLVLAVVMIMAMTIPAFAAANDDVAPCALCNGNHSYNLVNQEVTYSYSRNGCIKTTTKYYKCTYCTDNYSTSSKTTIPHEYIIKEATCNGTTQTHKYKCSFCKHVMYEYVACPRPGHISGNCSWLPI